MPGKSHHTSIALLSAAVVVWGMAPTAATAIAPCGDFGECKVLFEINSSDGDIGFHFLKDGAGLVSTRIKDPEGEKIFRDRARGDLEEQRYTEIFGESAEPLCWDDPEADPDEEIVPLEEFLGRWEAGTYRFIGKNDEGDKLRGETELTFDLPAAPINVAYDDTTGVISWLPGDDLGECATTAELFYLVNEGILPTHPMNVPLSTWEVVFSPDLDPSRNLAVRVAPGQLAVTLPADYLDALPDDTPGKIEVGGIGLDDNATFTEADICINESAGCN